MKKLFILLLSGFVFFSCIEQDILNDEAAHKQQSSDSKDEVLPRLLFSSKDELKEVLSQLEVLFWR